MKKEKKLYEQWWFWVIIGIMFIFVVSLIYQNSVDNSAYKDLGKETCEYANQVSIVANMYIEYTELIDPDTGEPFEILEPLDCSVWW